MPTVIRVRFRRDSREEGGRLVPAYAEDLDLDQLTPRARALAEALTDSLCGHISVRPLSIQFESVHTNRELWDLPPVTPEPYRSERDADQRALRTSTWDLLKSTDVRDLPTWLEEQAGIIPRDWYPIGTPRRPRVPSWEAAAADRYLTRDGVLAYMSDRGQAMTLTAWDTLRGTGHFPEPDRYTVSRQPHWLPSTVDAYLGRDRELWPLSRVAEYLGYGGDPKSVAGSTRKQLHRWGFTPVGRAPGRGGESLYVADQIQAVKARGRGRGRPRKENG